jgi:CheY-like chemotaxis protein
MKPNKYDLLLVDDDPEERYLMQLAFSDIGWGNAIRLFSSAEVLLRYLALLPETDFPSLLLFDYQMPRINGRQLMHMLKTSETFRHLPIAIYSSQMDEKMEQYLLTSGALRCFKKAINYAGALALATSLRSLAHAPLNS